MWKENLRIGLRIVFGLGMTIACFANRFDIACYGALMLILLQLEDMENIYNES